MTQHIFLSPHLDDAVLSCGGLLAQLTRQQQPVRVINIFAGSPPKDHPLSAFARYQHRQWSKALATQVPQPSGNKTPHPSSFVALRRAEDAAALSHFNAQVSYLNFPDCIYRGKAERNMWYYTADEDIFGPLHPAEAGLPQKIFRALQREIETTSALRLYAPLGVGNHVDHQLTVLAAAQLAKQGYPLTFYEDYPYAQRNPGDVSRAVQNCSQILAASLQPAPVFLSETRLRVKIRAISAYTSQLETLFGGQNAMKQQVTTFARAVGNGQLAEQLWQRKDASPI